MYPDWVSEWLLFNLKGFSPGYIIIKTGDISTTWWWCPIFTRPIQFVELLMMPVYWKNNKPRKKLSLQWRTLSWFRAKQSLLLFLDDVCLAVNHHITILQTLVWRDRGCKPRYITRRARYPLLNQYGFIPHIYVLILLFWYWSVYFFEWMWICAGFVFFAYLYCCWISNYQERVLGIPLTGLKPPHVAPVTNQELDFQHHMLFIFCVQWFKVGGSYWFYSMI